MGAYFDKYDPKSGGFRAPLDDDRVKTGTGNGLGMGINASGRADVGAQNTGVVGVMVITKDMKAGDIVDIMTDGEIVGTSFAAGDTVYAHATTGVLSTTPSAYRVGHVVEAGRLVVRMNTGAATDVVGDQAAVADLALATLTDAPATADALRDDLTTNWETQIEGKINAILTALRNAGIIAP